MSLPKVSILDYGMCNLLNVARAFNYCSSQIEIIDNPKSVSSSERLVVPGVGSFSHSMQEIRRLGFDDAILSYASTGRPLLGICVGMQILFDASEEFGNHSGLGLLNGRVQAIPSVDQNGHPQRVPHIGWNNLVQPLESRHWDETLLQPLVNTNTAVYFVHSFAAHPQHSSDRLADCIYGGKRICASVQNKNIMATQFHPERSGKTGLSILTRFLEL